jgi:hypothetical protein
MRLYNAICACLEAWAAAERSRTLEEEFETVDWNSSQED